MTFTIRQKRFMAVFIQQAPEELGRFVELTETEQSINETVEKTEQIVDVISAAGLVASIPTAGSAMAFASASIVLIKVGLEGYKFLKAAYQTDDPSACLEEAQREEKSVFLIAFLQLIAQNMAIRYRYQIDHLFAEKGVNEFAHYAVKRVIKKLRQLKVEHAEPHMAMSASELLGLASQLTDYLLASSKLAALSDTEKVTLAASHQSWGLMKSFAAEAKLLGARARWALVDQQGEMTFYASRTENELMKTDSTVKRFGYISLPLSDQPNTLVAVTPLVVKVEQVHVLKMEPAERLDLIKKMAFSHHVTRDEVMAYLEQHAMNGRAPISLNAYLSEKYHYAVIACCHDKTLQGLSLDHGDFSHVHFYGADLSHCSLRNTSFQAAHLGKAVFFKNMLDKQSDFQEAHLTWSSWQETALIGCFNHAIFNGAVLTDCQISDAFLQMGSEWFFVSMTRVTMVSQADKLQEMLQRLEDDLDQKTQCDQAIRDLKQQLEQCLEKLQQVQHTADFSGLDKRISALGERLTAYKNKFMSLPSSLAQDVPTISQRRVALNENVLQDIQEKYALLLSMCTLKKLETEQLERLQSTHKELWDHQHLLDSRLSDLEDNQRPLNRLKHYYEDELNLSMMSAERKSFVEPLVLNAQGTLVSMTEEVESFLASNYRLKFIHGVSGIGKTVAAKKIAEWLLREKDAKEKYTPHYIDLRDVKPAGSSNFLTTALGHIYSKTQLDAVKEDTDPLLILFDHVETSSPSLDVIFEDCYRYANPNWKFIFFAKTTYCRDVLQENDAGYFSVAPDCALQPFNNMQIQRFISAYLDQETWQRYHQLREVNPNLIEMMRIPILLTLIVWTFLIKKSNQYASPQNAKTNDIKNIPDFYSVFWQSWHKHVARHLPVEWREFEVFKKAMTQQWMAIYKNGLDYIDYEWQQKDNLYQDDHNAFIELYQAKINDFSPLYFIKVNNGLRVRFIHSSLWFNLVGEALIASLMKDRLVDWDERHLVDNHSLLMMLVQIIKASPQREEIEKKLLTLLEQVTNANHRVFKAAPSNLLTVLAQLRVVLKDKDYSGLNLNKVDLSKGVWIRVKVEGAVLTNAKLVDTTMLGCSIRGSDVTNTRFLEASAFVQFCSDVKTYAIYPSKQEVIIAYVLADPAEANKITLCKRTKQGVEQLAYWISHKQAIRCVDFAIYENVVRFASAGDGGKISVSEVVDGLMTHVCSLTSSTHKAPLNLLKFAPDGHLIASLCEENYLRIWNVNQRVRQSKFKVQDVVMTSLVWRQEELLTGGSDGIVYSWRKPSLSDVDRYHAWTFTPIDFRQAAAGGVQSIALSWNLEQMAVGFQNGPIAVMTFDAQKTVHWLDGHTAAVTTLVFTPEALASGSADYTLRLWRNRVDVTILPHEYPIGKIDLLWNGTELISGAGVDSHWLYFWDLSLYSQPGSIEDVLGVVAVVAAYKNSYLAAGFMNGAVAVWPLDQPQKDPTIAMHHRHTTVSRLEWSPSGQFLLSRGKNGVFLLKNMTDKTSLATELSGMNQETRDFVWATVEGHDVLLTCSSAYGLDLWQINESVTKELVLTKKFFSFGIPADEQEGFDRLALVPLDQQQSMLMMVLANPVGLYMSYLNKGYLKSAENKAYVEPIFTLTATDQKIQQLLCLTESCFVMIDGQNTITVWDMRDQSRKSLWQSNACITAFFMSDNRLFVATPQAIYDWDMQQAALWYKTSPTKVSMRSTTICAQGNEHLVVAKHHGIALFDRKSLKESNVLAWRRSIKPGSFVDDLDISHTQGMAPQTEELLKSHHVRCDQQKRYTFFSRKTAEEPCRLPPPSERPNVSEHHDKNIDFSSEVIRNNSSQGLFSMEMD